MPNSPSFAAMKRVRSCEDGTFERLEKWTVIDPVLADRLTVQLPFVCRERDVPLGVVTRIVMTNEMPYLRFHLETDSDPLSDGNYQAEDIQTASCSDPGV